MTLILQIILLIALYAGGLLIGRKLGPEGSTGKIALAIVGISVVGLLAGLISPAAFGQAGQLMAFSLAFGLGTFRGTRLVRRSGNNEQPPQS